MTQPGDIFLGNAELSRSVNGCAVEVTGYTHTDSFEDWHSHKNASISFLLDGSHREDLFGISHQRVPGDIKFIPAGEMHRCTGYVAGTRKINVDLDQNILNLLEISEDGIIALLRASQQPKFTLLKFYHALNNIPDHTEADTQLMLYELFHPVKNKLKYTAGQPPVWVTLLKQILFDEWDTAFELNDLAGRIGVHPVTISRYFPQYFSSTLSNYVRSIKVDKALAMIKGTKLSLTDIAYACGFADQAHFTRTFKELTGYLPKDFRKV